jgi:ABC-type bacteriocin/lantibiotic exporter with double-glycine peptidase domain
VNPGERLRVGAVTTAIGESTAKHEAAGWLEHLARMPGAFRSLEARRDAHARADHIARRYRDARRAHFRRILRHLYGGIAIKIAGATLLLGVGGALVIANQLTLGQLVASELVFAAIGAAMLKLYKQLEVVYDLMSAAHKLGLLLDLPQERRGGEAPVADGPARVVLRDVAVGYPDHAVATGVTTVIEPRDRVLLDGDGASGKSTLLDALAATLPPSGGTLELDGVDLRLADLDAVRRSIVLLREPELVASSVLGNLRLSRPELGLSEIGEVLRVVGLETAVDALPDGLATPLLPSGRPLSRTQTRRLALARALLAKPRLLLVDGALDELGLPAADHERLLDHVLGPDAPWTAVVVSNDARVRRRCTRAMALHAGRLEVK